MQDNSGMSVQSTVTIWTVLNNNYDIST